MRCTGAWNWPQKKQRLKIVADVMKKKQLQLRALWKLQSPITPVQSYKSKKECYA